MYYYKLRVLDTTGNLSDFSDVVSAKLAEDLTAPRIIQVNPPQPDPSVNCSCACHKGGIAKVFFKIGLFFQKIFGKNRMCICGVSHY